MDTDGKDEKSDAAGPVSSQAFGLSPPTDR
jgi:hypothetical protein